MMQRRENELDALFRKKLEDLDMGRQDHLWQGIADQLSKNKRSSRYIGFAWFAGLLLSFTLLGLGITTAYRFNLENHSESKNTIQPQSEVAQIVTNESNIANVGEASSTEILRQENDNQEAHKATNVDKNDLAANVKIIKKSNLKNTVNQEFNSKLSNSLTTNHSISNTEKTAFATSKQTEVSNSSPDNQISNSLELQKGINAEVGRVDNSTTVAFKSESQTASNNDLASNSSINSIYKVEALTMLSSNKTLELNTVKSRTSNKRLKLPINDYCLSKNFTPLHHFDIDLYYSPEIATRTITARTEAATPYAQKRAGSESFSGASTFGLRLSYVTKNGLALRTGVNLSSISEKFEYFDGKETVTKIIYDQFNKPIDTIYTTVDKIVNQKNV